MRYILAVSAALIFLINTASAQTSLYISQVQITGGRGQANQDFIELFNASSSPLDLKGYKLVKRSSSGTGDDVIKSWTKSAIIPPYSFYLWANSSFASVAVKPDITTSATISEDNGVGLKFGSQTKDSLSWGSARNGFGNVSKTNPTANQALVRKDLYSDSGFFLAASHPRNSSINDLTAAYSDSQKKPVAAASAKPAVAAKASPPQMQEPAPTAVLGTTTVQQPETKKQEVKFTAPGKPQPQSPKTRGWGYLAAAAVAAAALLFMVKKFLWPKKAVSAKIKD